MKTLRYVLVTSFLGLCPAAMAGEPGDPYSTIKLGQDIQFIAKQINIPEPGDTADLELTLLENLDQGIMKLEIINSSGLEFSQSPERFSVNGADGDVHKMNLKLSASSAGRHYINVRVTQEGLFGPQSSIYAIPVQIGPRNQTPSKSQNGQVVFQADEEIR